MENTIKIFFAVSFSFLLIACDKDVSTTPPDEPPPQGTVMINSIPEGAKIFLNGKYRIRRTPDSLRWLAEQSYDVTLKKEFYKDTTFRIHPSEEELKTYVVDYTKSKRMLATLEIYSTPSDASITLNGIQRDQRTPEVFRNILPGLYEVTLEKEKHKSVTEFVEVNSGDTVQTFITLLDTVTWKTMTPENSGIPFAYLNSLAIDVNDNIWIGTSNRGAAFFDGVSWTIHDIYSTNIGDNRVNVMDVDVYNNLWVGTPDSLAFFQEKKWEDHGKNYLLPNPNVTALYFRNKGCQWVGTINGLLDFAEQWVYNLDNSSLQSTHITSIAEGKDGKIWVGTHTGGVSVKKINKWDTYSSSNSNLHSNRVSDIAVDQDGYIWAAHSGGAAKEGGVSYFDGIKWRKVATRWPCSNITCVAIDNNNVKWFGTTKGIGKITGTNKFEFFSKLSAGFEVDNITDVAVDRSGRVWFATSGGGLLIYN